jgi:Domain of unknown function (DUF222)
MTAMATPRHRVSVAVAHAHAEIDAVADASVWSMTPEETTATLVEITRLESQLAELKLRVVDHADADTVDRWTHATKQTRPVVRRAEKLAVALTVRHHVRDALAAGDLVTDQARVIVQALAQLPAGLEPDLIVKAERHLVGEARHHGATALTVLGKRLLDAVAPDLADAHEARLLEREEADALAGTKLTMRDNGRGSCVGTFEISTFHGAALKQLLLADTDARPLQGPARMGHAFCRLIEGHARTTVVVTMSYESLVGDLEEAGVLDTGETISPALARRLACEAGIRPAVLGGKSEVLDLGRSRRLHSKAQRIAIALRDKHCTHPGCDWPPAMCHVHHDDEWGQGGGTDLANGRLLCPRHHARYHRRT